MGRAVGSGGYSSETRFVLPWTDIFVCEDNTAKLSDQSFGLDMPDL